MKKIFPLAWTVTIVLATEHMKCHIWVVVVLRSPIHANEPSEYNGMLYRTSNRVLNNGIKVIILICMDGTSQYHHHPYLYCVTGIDLCKWRAQIKGEKCILEGVEIQKFTENGRFLQYFCSDWGVMGEVASTGRMLPVLPFLCHHCFKSVSVGGPHSKLQGFKFKS